jgi:hypothetical protein
VERKRLCIEAFRLQPRLELEKLDYFSHGAWQIEDSKLKHSIPVTLIDPIDVRRLSCRQEYRSENMRLLSNAKKSFLRRNPLVAHQTSSMQPISVLSPRR